MKEKTLLYSALGFTALAAAFAVYKVRAETSPTRTKIEITPVSLTESAKSLAPAEVPIQLTASDGTGLELVALRAEATVEDPLALTELHLTFENRGDRVLEGTFRITLPQSASLSRFAMKVGGAWQEGEVVEKQAARQAYEDFLHRRQDPALMEQGAGNEFSARVFPIHPHATKEIILTYAEAVEVGAPYVLPLRGLPQLGSLDVNVHVAGVVAAATGGKTDGHYGIHQSRFTPAADFVLDAKTVPRSPGLRSSNLAIARIIPFTSSRPEPIGSAVVLVDTSASRGLGLGDQANALKDLLGRVPGDTNVIVACFDQDVLPIYEGKASGFGEKEVGKIAARGALGASDFEHAIVWAGAEAKKKKAARVVFLTDGVATAGELDAQKLRVHVEKLRDAGVVRMDAIAMGGIRDDGFLRTVVRGVLDRDGVVLDAKLGGEALAHRLGEATSGGVAVKVEGARWSYPSSLDGLQSGDEVLVYAEYAAGDGARPVKIDVGGQVFQPDLRTIDRPLVERAWAQAKIQSLIEEPRENAAMTKQEIVALSTRHRVLSPHTALLVLENDSDYQRFNIDRNAKVDILAVRDGRVAVTQSHRTAADEAQAKPAAADEKNKQEKAAEAPAARSAPLPTPPPAYAPPATAPPVYYAPQGVSPVSPASPGVITAPEQPVTALAPVAPAAPVMPAPLPTMAAQEPPPASPLAPKPAMKAPTVRSRPSRPAITAGADDGDEKVAAPAKRPRRKAESEDEDESSRRFDDRPAPHSPAPPVPPASVRPLTASNVKDLDLSEIQRAMRGAAPRIRECYASELSRNALTRGTLMIHFTIDKQGVVKAAELERIPGSDAFRRCVAGVAKSVRLQTTDGGAFTYSFELVGGGGTEANMAEALPYEGRFKSVMEALTHGSRDIALDEATRWHAEQPGDILSLVALGEVFEARNELDQAARAYGSILELFSFRADSRRFAGERLERLHHTRALALAADTYGKAVEQRPDHPASHRLHAYALLKKGEHEKAFEAIKNGIQRTYPEGRFSGVDRILREDAGLIAAAWTHAQPKRAAEIKSRLRAAGGTEENGPSIRFVLNWETDANDVDFHIADGRGGHAFYSQPRLPSGGDLYADVTTGYGPECFTIRGPRATLAFPYTLQAHYYQRGPMGYGMGKVEILEHDGKGTLTFAERPFVVMVDQAYVDMGTVDRSTKLSAL